jgi:hypothetical protein
MPIASNVFHHTEQGDCYEHRTGLIANVDLMPINRFAALNSFGKNFTCACNCFIAGAIKIRKVLALIVLDKHIAVADVKEKTAIAQ